MKEKLLILIVFFLLLITGVSIFNVLTDSSAEYIDYLNCNPEVLSQFSHPAFFILPILGVLLVLVALIIGIKNEK